MRAPELHALADSLVDSIFHNYLHDRLDYKKKERRIVAAILGLVGGVRVYSKFSSGDPDASKSATALFLSCVFLVIVGTVLRSFFL